jgi:pyruvate carboxylase
LGDEWDAVKTAYAAANRALGDIVKVAGEGGRVFGGFKKTPKKPNP